MTDHHHHHHQQRWLCHLWFFYLSKYLIQSFEMKLKQFLFSLSLYLYTTCYNFFFSMFVSIRRRRRHHRRHTHTTWNYNQYLCVWMKIYQSLCFSWFHSIFFNICLYIQKKMNSKIRASWKKNLHIFHCSMALCNHYYFFFLFFFVHSIQTTNDSILYDDYYELEIAWIRRS